MRLMHKKLASSSPTQQEYQRLRRCLGQLGYISQGSVQDRTARKGGGAGYQWTRKVAQKTVTVSLTAEQFARMKEAVSNYRQLRQQLKQLESLSRRIIFQSTPNPRRRKRLTQKVLGTN
jgi:virulence-associated protein VapD